MKNRLKYKNFLLLLLIGFVYVSYKLGSQQIQIYKFNKEIKANNEVIKQLEKETQSLNKNKERYKSDEFIEKVAREKLGYVKPGERVYIDKTPE